MPLASSRARGSPNVRTCVRAVKQCECKKVCLTRTRHIVQDVPLLRGRRASPSLGPFVNARCSGWAHLPLAVRLRLAGRKRCGGAWMGGRAGVLAVLKQQGWSSGRGAERGWMGTVGRTRLVEAVSPVSGLASQRLLCWLWGTQASAFCRRCVCVHRNLVTHGQRARWLISKAAPESTNKESPCIAKLRDGGRTGAPGCVAHEGRVHEPQPSGRR